MGFKFWQKAVAGRKVYNFLLTAARKLQKGSIAENGMITSMAGPAKRWTKDRDLPPIAAKTFTERWQSHHKHNRPENR
jgi:hypothetical protein